MLNISVLTSVPSIAYRIQRIEVKNSGTAILRDCDEVIMKCRRGGRERLIRCNLFAQQTANNIECIKIIAVATNWLLAASSQGRGVMIVEYRKWRVHYNLWASDLGFRVGDPQL